MFLFLYTVDPENESQILHLMIMISCNFRNFILSKFLMWCYQNTQVLIEKQRRINDTNFIVALIANVIFEDDNAKFQLNDHNALMY